MNKGILTEDFWPTVEMLCQELGIAKCNVSDMGYTEKTAALI